MGWGERHGRSADMVCRNDERVKADELAAAVRAFEVKATTGNCRRMFEARDRYLVARTARSDVVDEKRADE